MNIKFEAVSFSYNHRLPQQIKVLSNINFEIATGELIGIVGPTGSGKTTLLQHFTGLLKPASGIISVDGKDIWQRDFPLSDLRNKIGLVFQFPESQLFEETVFADIAFAPRSQKLSAAEIEHRVKSALKLVGLDYDLIKNRSPYHLSQGEMRRVALAGVLAMAPEMLILDEPTSGLDPAGTSLIVHILQRLQQEGKTIIIISHNMDLIFQLVNRFLVLDHGEIIFDGDKQTMLNSAHLLTKARLNLPRVIKLSRFLWEQGIIQDWKIFSRAELEKQLTS